MKGATIMVSHGQRNVITIGAIFFFSGVLTSIPAASVWLQNTQLEQYWLGSQWKDSTSDSTAWEARGLISSIAHAVNQGTNGLIDNTLALKEYDPEKEQIQDLVRAYNKAQGVWDDTIQGMKWTRLKDANKRDTAVEVQSLNTADGKWYKAIRSRYHYHADMLVDTTIEAIWDTSGGVGKWLNTTRTIENYGTGLKSVLTTIDIWSKGDLRWLKKYKTARVYNNKALVIADTTATWDTTESKYIYNQLHVYTYDSHDKDTTTITMTYSKALDDFLNILREVYEYDDNGNQTVYISHRWTKNPSGNGIWLQTDRRTDTYSDKSKILTTLNESYDSSAAKWNKGGYEEWAYDGNGNAQSETFSVWDTTENPDKYVPIRKLNWTYVQLTVGTIRPMASSKSAVLKMSIMIKPKNIIVSGQEGMNVSVFGINGRKLVSLAALTGKSTVAWNYSDAMGNRVPTGSYVLKISAPGLNSVFPVSIFR
jgi:hypothetical protein